MKFCLRVNLKPSNDQGEFDWARCNQHIAENSFALGRKTESSSVTILIKDGSSGPHRAGASLAHPVCHGACTYREPCQFQAHRKTLLFGANVTIWR